MNLERDLQKLKKEKQMKESAIAQLRKRSKDSIARPKAEKKYLDLGILKNKQSLQTTIK